MYLRTGRASRGIAWVVDLDRGGWMTAGPRGGGRESHEAPRLVSLPFVSLRSTLGVGVPSSSGSTGFRVSY
jgi:hypothetical protein